MLQSWDWYQFNNYFKVKEGADVTRLQSKFQEFTKPFLKGDGPTFLPLFQTLHQIYLYSSEFKHDMAMRGNITYVNALIVVAIFVLLIACFNFINLTTAKSLNRAKEVGVRKSIGANKTQLIQQFLGEAIIFAFISISLSTLLTIAFLPSLNNFTEKNISFNLFTNPLIFALLILLVIIVGIIAGIYPALVLSSFKPVKVLKGSNVNNENPGRTPWLRHGLVIVQFSLSVLLIISAIVVIRQVNYLHNKDLGFKKEQIMFFPMRGENMNKNYETLKHEILQSPNVSSVSVGYGFPGDMVGDGIMTVLKNGEQVKAVQLMVDDDYIKTLGLELIAGRDFSNERKSDKDAAYIINETAVKDLGFGTPEQALGEILLWPTWRNPELVKKGQVIGVVKDFHFKSLYDKVEPAVLQIYPEAYWKVAVKLKTSGLSGTIEHIKAVWSRFSPDYPLEYNFLDESFSTMYKAEDKLKSLIWIFTLITIFVSCLGLFGLAAFATEGKSKEIGIRKVLGASEKSIIVLLSKDFAKLIIIALLFASPLAWYVMNFWLENFPYRI